MESVDTDWAWLAGFIDGEGCFHFSTPTSPVGIERAQMTLSISQSDDRVLKKVLSIIGIGHINGPYADKGKGHYLYRVTGPKNILWIVQQLESYLGEVKRGQFDRAWSKLIEWHSKEDTMPASLRNREAQHRYAGFDTPDESRAYRLLTKHPNRWISQRQVENATRMSSSCANSHLLSLFRGGVIERERPEGRNYWTYRVVA